jgi:hypothetical protein
VAHTFVRIIGKQISVRSSPEAALTNVEAKRLNTLFL